MTTRRHLKTEHHQTDTATSRPVVSGTQGVISSGHPLVSMAGMRMLLDGGNAFDAAVAAGFAAAVVEPTASYTLCGECVALVHDVRRGETVAVSGQGTAPALATIDFFRGRQLDRIPTGPGPDAHLSFTVPGAVDAYFTVLESFGTRSLGEVLAPALHYAEHGFPMYEYMHKLLAIPESRSQFDLYPPGGTDVFYPGGRAPRAGAATGRPASRLPASASTAATSPPPSARSPSGWAGSCARVTSRDIARASSRRRAWPSQGATSWARRRGPRDRCFSRPSACSKRSICAPWATTPRPTSTRWRRRSSSASPIASAITATRRRAASPCASCSPPPTCASARSSSAWIAPPPSSRPPAIRGAAAT